MLMRPLTAGLVLVPVGFVLSGFGLVETVAAQAEDPAAVQKLQGAKDVYRAERERFRKEAQEWFDRREAAARSEGDKAAVDAAQAERQLFDERGFLSAQAPSALKRKGQLMRRRMEEAYQGAVKELLKAKLDDAAHLADRELLVFRSGGDIDDQRWLWKHAKGEFRLLEPGLWQEKSAQNVFRYRELGRTAEFVEFHAITGNTMTRFRLTTTEADVGHTPQLQFRPVYFGGWVLSEQPTIGPAAGTPGRGSR